MHAQHGGGRGEEGVHIPLFLENCIPVRHLRRQIPQQQLQSIIAANMSDLGLNTQTC
jgi:hypothetical protein